MISGSASAVVRVEAESCISTTQWVCLTFDDGPSPLYTERLLDGLKERGVVATFFVTGENAESCPDHPALLPQKIHLASDYLHIH